MKKIFNLWLYELGKSKFMLGFLMIVFFIIQVLVHLMRILRIDPKNINVEDTRSVTDLVQSRFGMNLALMAAFIIIIIASVYIWVKEFRSKGNFINRLFLLPGNRMQVYFAKFLTILSYILVLQITQFIILGVNKALLIWRFPVLVDHVQYSDFLNSGSMLQYLLPLNGTAICDFRRRIESIWLGIDGGIFSGILCYLLRYFSKLYAIDAAFISYSNGAIFYDNVVCSWIYGNSLVS